LTVEEAAIVPILICGEALGHELQRVSDYAALANAVVQSPMRRAARVSAALLPRSKKNLFNEQKQATLLSGGIPLGNVG
jgi:hypothetical protein